MSNWFNRALALPKIKHSSFDLSHDLKTSVRIGYLNPVGWEEVLPSDRVTKHNTEVFIRFAPLKYPLMHRVKVHTSNFFVPLRIILGEDLYRQFLNNEVELQPIEVQLPERFGNPFVNTLLDYLEYDVMGAYNYDEERWSFKMDNPVPFLAYLCCVRDWYCDSTLQKTDIDKIDALIEQYRSNVEGGIPFVLTDEFTPLIGLFNVSYSKDYFNTARPQPQNGEEMYVLNRPAQFTGNDRAVGVFVETDGYLRTSEAPYTPLSETTTIKDVWRKEMLQRYYEIDNVFGKNRIREKLAGHFGVDYSDKRIEIPLVCGGSSSVAQISEVISQSTSGDGLGVFGGKGIVTDVNRGRKMYFEEHGIYMTFLSLIPDNGYCRGQHRYLFKKNIFDFASPEFNNIGWQDVFRGELFVDQEQSGNTDTWAYQPRYSEYRSHPSRCTGAFRAQNEELAWHLNRNFDDVPPLNGDFLKVADVNRIFNQQDLTDSDAPLYVDVYHQLEMSRPISYEPDSMHLY